MKLTPNQRLQLLALYEAGAISRGCSVAAGDLHFCSTLVIGKLRDMDLADSKTMHRLGRQWTEYWLTDIGICEATRLAGGRTAA